MEPQEISSMFMWAGVAAVVLTGVLAVMGRSLGWKGGLIVAVLMLAMGYLYPPDKKLRLGIDLSGGVSLLYQVDTSGQPNSEEALRHTIETLKNRVDPDGLLNLVWQVEAGNRIQIQMPLPGKDVAEKRKVYLDLLEAFGKANLKRAQLSAAFELPDDTRDARLKELAAGVAGRFEKLQVAAAAQQEARKQRAVLAGLTPGTAEHIEAAGKVAEAEIAFERALAGVLATNLKSSELERLLGLSTDRQSDKVTGKPVAGSSAREKELDRVLTQYPERADEIRKLASAFDAYAAIRGSLDDPEDLTRLIQGAGVLEFRIVVDLSEATGGAALLDNLERRGPGGLAASGPQRWFAVDDPADFFNDEEEGWKQALAAGPAAARVYTQQNNYVGSSYGGRYYVLLWNTPDKSITANQGDWALKAAYRSADNFNFPAVGFEMDTRGASLMGSLTGGNVNRLMAIVLDDRVFSAPVIKGRIAGSGQISGGRGGFSEAEIDYLIRTLNAGHMKGRLSSKPIEVRVFQPSLGKENLEHGLQAAIWSIVAVGAFMAVYYFFAGAVANMALAANVVVILGILAMRNASFTLPGIAGIVLTIGMCVDANVLIFERIREELRRGSDMATALRLGYERAFSSIIDGNLTNLLVCIILYVTSSAEIRGFAVTLGIGIGSTMFTALFMTRVIFDLYYKRVPAARPLSMLPMAVGAVEKALSPSIEWIEKKKAFYSFSGILLAASLAAVALRGADILDIEFRAGTEVAFDLSAGKRLSHQEVVDRLKNSDLAGATVIGLGELDQSRRSGAFSVMTTQTDQDQVAETVRRLFADALDVQPQVHFAGDQEIAAAKVVSHQVFPILSSDLAQVLSRPDARTDVSDFIGGAAIVLGDLKQGEQKGVPLDQLRDRLKFMRMQPDYADVQYREYDVLSLREEADGRVREAVVLVSDASIRADEDLEQWRGALAEREWKLVREAMERQKSLSKISNFTPTMAATLRDNAIAAVILGFLGIIAYIWFRFGSLRYGLAAVAALVHDVIITLGLIAASSYLYDLLGGNFLGIEPFKLNMAMIAAILTIIGYSLNDTIIVFDRIRENRGRLKEDTSANINLSINQTISRTLITSGTTLMTALVLYFAGGSGVHGFAFALVVGVGVGTYSSIAIASPLLLAGGLKAGETRPSSVAVAGNA